MIATYMRLFLQTIYVAKARWRKPLEKSGKRLRGISLCQFLTVKQIPRNSTPSSGFAFLGDATDIRYQVLTSCDLQMVGEEFSRKPYAVAVQQGSPLKDQFNNA